MIKSGWAIAMERSGIRFVNFSDEKSGALFLMGDSDGNAALTFKAQANGNSMVVVVTRHKDVEQKLPALLGDQYVSTRPLIGISPHKIAALADPSNCLLDVRRISEHDCIGLLFATADGKRWLGVSYLSRGRSEGCAYFDVDSGEIRDDRPLSAVAFKEWGILRGTDDDLTHYMTFPPLA